MKASSILTTIFLLTSALPTLAYPSSSRLWKWDTDNIQVSDIRFNPEFLISSIPVEDSRGAKFELIVQCGNNRNSYYRQFSLQSKAEKMATDKDLVTTLCTQAFEKRDVYVRQLLLTETCRRINWEYGISSIPVALYGELARKKDREGDGFACSL
jgi:hypothetical protein